MKSAGCCLRRSGERLRRSDEYWLAPSAQGPAPSAQGFLKGNGNYLYHPTFAARQAASDCTPAEAQELACAQGVSPIEVEPPKAKRQCMRCRLTPWSDGRMVSSVHGGSKTGVNGAFRSATQAEVREAAGAPPCHATRRPHMLMALTSAASSAAMADRTPTSLRRAAGGPDPAVLTALLDQHLMHYERAICARMVDSNMDESGRSPLHHACWRGSLANVELLLDLK